MVDIVKELTIEAAPQHVWSSLTQLEEIAGWWTDDLSATSEVGSLAEFRFTQWGAGVFQFEVAELDQNEKVSWICRQGPPQGQGPVSRGNSRLSTTGQNWSSLMMGSPRLITSMNRHAGIGTTSCVKAGNR